VEKANSPELSLLKIFAISLPSQPFLCRLLGFHIFFHYGLFGAAPFFTARLFWIRYLYLKTTYINRVQNSKLVVVQKLLLEPTGSQVCIILINSGIVMHQYGILLIIKLADIIIHISADTDHLSNVY